jgi:hypothetical protein
MRPAASRASAPSDRAIGRERHGLGIDLCAVGADVQRNDTPRSTHERPLLWTSLRQVSPPLGAAARVPSCVIPRDLPVSQRLRDSGTALVPPCATAPPSPPERGASVSRPSINDYRLLQASHDTLARMVFAPLFHVCDVFLMRNKVHIGLAALITEPAAHPSREIIRL